MEESIAMQELADGYARAAAAADESALRRLFAPGAVVWHNHDGIETPFEESAAAFARWLSNFDAHRFTLDRMIAGEDGFVLQTTIAGSWRGSEGGEAVEFEGHYCLVFSVAEGRVTRLDEYTDPQTLALG